jgi:hypothetical protein
MAPKLMLNADLSQHNPILVELPQHTTAPVSTIVLCA